MKPCRRFRKKLSACLDGETKGSERFELEKHLRTCRACREELDELSRLRLCLGELEELPSSPHLWPAVLTAVSPAPRKKWSFPFSSLREFTPAPVAVTALLIIAVGIWAGVKLGTIMYRQGFYPASPPSGGISSEVDYLSVFYDVPPGSVGQVYIETADVESNS